MNQPRRCCITGRLLTEPRNFSSLDVNADVVDDDNDDWQDIDQGVDFPVDNMDIGPGSDFIKEAPNSTGGTQIRESDLFIELYPGGSTNYGRGKTFMDTFDTDRFSSEHQNNLFYPFASKAEWEFTSWLANSGLSMAAINKCLSLDIVCFSPDQQQILMLCSRSNHSSCLFGQRKCSASLSSCYHLGPSGSDGLLNPNHLRNMISNYSTETPLNVFSTSYTRCPSMDG